MDENDFIDRDEVAEESARRMDEYRAALESDRDLAVARFFETLERDGPSTLTLQPFMAMYMFDERRAAGMSEEARRPIFKQSLDDLARMVIFCDSSSEPWLPILRRFACRAALYAGEIDRAEVMAFELLTESEHRFPMWRDMDTKHFAEQIFGQIALRRGDQKEAVRFLLSSVESGDAPVLSSFGPKMRLANELYEAGERDSILTYLERIDEFWDSELDPVGAWIAAMQSGKDPRDENWMHQMVY